jgi:hypothetical protein
LIPEAKAIIPSIVSFEQSLHFCSIHLREHLIFLPKAKSECSIVPYFDPTPLSGQRAPLAPQIQHARNYRYQFETWIQGHYVLLHT